MTARPNKLLAYFKKSLVARFVVSIALPVLLVMTSMSVAHYWRERRLLEDQIELAALQMGEVFRGSLRHAMLANDGEMIVEILQNMDGMENILQVRLINLDGWVVADSSGNTTGQILSRDDAGCIECHRFEPENRPHTTRLAIAPQVLRITTPIANEADCRACHAADDAHLGVLVADVSLIDIERHLEDDLRIELLVSAVMMGVVMATIYLLVHRLVVRRMLNLREPLARLSGGDFSVRLPVSPGPEDELDRLAKLLNRMAEALQRHTRRQEERHQLRQRVIIEERERIARELHDGLAQLLGYVNTKAMAVRLHLQNRQLEPAEENLLQLEEAARAMFADVRIAILELKTTDQCCGDLEESLTNFVTQFQNFSGITVELAISPAVHEFSLAEEAEVQLLRIIQEALTNIRKHAATDQARVTLTVQNGALELTVSDNGRGFDPAHTQTGSRPHFGLGIMRERAKAVGAEFTLTSEPGAGTRVAVRLPLEEN